MIEVTERSRIRGLAFNLEEVEHAFHCRRSGLCCKRLFLT